jgi:1-acyl-sn-glycerol-3-phosphate acyltransferase
VLSIGLAVVVHWLLPQLAALARLWLARAVGITALLGSAGLWCGASLEPAPAFLFLLAPIGLLAAVLWPRQREPSSSAQCFLLDRGHVSNALARRSLIAGGCHALLAATAIALVHSSPAASGYFAPIMSQIGIFYIVGIGLSLWQRYPQRAAGLIPVAAILATIAFLMAWIAPAAEWPLLFLSVALGLAHSPPRIDLLADLPPRQRGAGMILMIAAQTLGVLIGIALIRLVPSIRISTFVISIVLAVVAVWSYMRELIELLVEPILAVTYPIRGYGPGVKAIPTRGPVLVIANHSTWLDPLWVAKLMPLRVRPLMTSRFYDLPLISWLMRKVFHTIRVPDAGFRRETPEIQQAIAALEHGENVLIFPEGWLKRREEQSVRRFGQGVYQILREKPRTPVIACWIEGGWGSYTSFWNGPPTKNKKLDFFRRIRIGISPPQVLSLEVLSDQIHTRRHLMQACLHARTYLGLPELPPPAFGVDGESDEDKD